MTTMEISGKYCSRILPRHYVIKPYQKSHTVNIRSNKKQKDGLWCPSIDVDAWATTYLNQGATCTARIKYSAAASESSMSVLLKLFKLSWDIVVYRTCTCIMNTDFQPDFDLTSMEFDSDLVDLTSLDQCTWEWDYHCTRPILLLLWGQWWERKT